MKIDEVMEISEKFEVLEIDILESKEIVVIEVYVEIEQIFKEFIEYEVKFILEDVIEIFIEEVFLVVLEQIIDLVVSIEL